MKKFIFGLIVSASFAYFGTKWKIHHDVEQGVDMAIMGMSPYAVIEYDGISSTLTGELTIDGIRGRVRGYDDEFHIGRLGIDTPSFLSLMKLGDMETYTSSGEDILPEYFGVIIEGLRMPADADYGTTLYNQRVEELGVDDADEPANQCTGRYSLSPETLVAMDYTEYDMSFSARFRQVGNRYSVEIRSSAAEMWSVDADLLLDGDMVTELAKGPRYRPRLSEMRLEYTDHSLNERIQKYCTELGLSEEEALAARLETFQFYGREYGIEFDEYVLEPFKDFLAGKPTLIFTAKPGEPVAFSQISLYKPSDVPALLRLSAEAR